MVSRGISHLQIPLSRRMIPQREIVATLRTFQLIFWDPVISECLSWGLWDFLQLSWRYLPRNNTSYLRWLKSLLVQWSGDLSPILEYNPAKLCWLFRAILRKLIPINLIFGVFIWMAFIYSPEWVSEISQGLTGVLSVLFCFLPWLD